MAVVFGKEQNQIGLFLFICSCPEKQCVSPHPSKPASSIWYAHAKGYEPHPTERELQGIRQPEQVEHFRHTTPSSHEPAYEQASLKE